MENTQLIPVPAFTDNYIWMASKNGHAIVVDPGESAPVEAMLSRNGWTLDAILLTHHHGDHVGGVLSLQRRTGAPVYGPARERLPACDYPMREGDEVQFSAVGLTLQVLDVPGHTAGHIAYHGTLDDQRVLFCGDTLFAGGCGRLFEGTPEQMVESLSKLASLPPDTLVCCAHEYTQSNLRWARAVEPGNADLQRRWENVSHLRAQGLPTLPSTVEEERLTNPFLRASQPEVAQAAAHFAGKPLTDPVAVFASLRQWKNDF